MFWNGRHHFQGAIFIAVALFGIPGANAQQKTDRAKELYKEFAETAESLTLVPIGEKTSFVLQRNPLQRFTATGNVYGCVYVWHDAQRRLAMIGTIGSIPLGGQDYEFVELHLLKPKRVAPAVITGLPTKRWEPEVDSLKLRPVADAPSVSNNDRLRLVQMRTIARRFTASLGDNDRKRELRLLPQPFYRYSKSTAEFDGAVFAFVGENGTDPEVLLRLETRSDDSTANTSPSWHYQPIRFNWRALALEYDGVEVWRVDELRERNQPRQVTPYITGLTRHVR